ncbi:hypothetical protein D3C71_1515640 [compost metagenome]
MCPMIERIPDNPRNGSRPCQELFIVTSITSNELLLYTICPHHSPFVMVAIKPSFGNIVERLVLINLLRTEVAMIVDNRHIFRMIMKQLNGGLARQQEVLIHEFFAHEVCCSPL